NPLTQGVANHLMPKCAHAYASDRFDDCRRLVDGYTLRLLLAMCCLTVPLCLFGGALIVFLFGRDFSDLGLVIAILALAALVRTVAMPAYIGLWAFARSGANAAINVFGLLFLIVSIAWAFPRYGLVGA